MERRRDVAWNGAELRFRLVVGDVPEHLLGAFLGLVLRLAGEHQRHVSELVVGRRRQPFLAEVLAHAVEHLGEDIHRGQEHGEHIAALDHLAGGLQVAAAGDPDRRMGLLVGTRPYIDLALVDETAFVVERAVMGGPRLDDQVDGLPHALARRRRVGVRRQQLVGHAAHEAAIQPPARDVVHHRHLLGTADRVGQIGDRVAEDADARVPGLARQDGAGQRRRRKQACRRLVVLVDHDVQAEFVGQNMLVEIHVVKIGADLGVVHAARQVDAHRGVFVLRRKMRPRKFGEVVGFHLSVFLFRRPSMLVPVAPGLG